MEKSKDHDFTNELYNVKQAASNTSPFKTYSCDENGLSLLCQALDYLEAINPKNDLNVLKAINRIEWFLGNEINEVDEVDKP